MNMIWRYTGLWKKTDLKKLQSLSILMREAILLKVTIWRTICLYCLKTKRVLSHPYKPICQMTCGLSSKSSEPVCMSNITPLLTSNCSYCRTQVPNRHSMILPKKIELTHFINREGVNKKKLHLHWRTLKLKWKTSKGKMQRMMLKIERMAC